MMKKVLSSKQLFAVALLFLFLITYKVNGQTITVTNNSNKLLKDCIVEIPVEDLSLLLGSYVVLDTENKEFPLEITTDLRGDQKAIFPISKFPPNTTKIFHLRKGSSKNYPKRTYAELAHKIGGKFVGNKYEGGFSWVKPNFLSVDGNFRDHAYFIKYEGPGWESDKVGFRFYLDQRNAIDVFGKKTSDIVLPFVGVDGYDNYHAMADWGMDNMKVGKSLGLGSIGIWNGDKAVRVEERDSALCYIPTDGKIRSQVMTTFFGWNANGIKCNLESLISIDAGSRASKMELFVDKQIDNIATGIIKAENTEFIHYNNPDSKWSYIATFGKQSLNDDMLGLVVFYKTKQLKQITQDDLNHVVVLTPENGYVEYYFMPTWELDWEPVNNKETFIQCIDEVMNKLNHPLSFHFKNK